MWRDVKFSNKTTEKKKHKALRILRVISRVLVTYIFDETASFKFPLNDLYYKHKLHIALFQFRSFYINCR